MGRPAHSERTLANTVAQDCKGGERRRLGIGHKRAHEHHRISAGCVVCRKEAGFGAIGTVDKHYLAATFKGEVGKYVLEIGLAVEHSPALPALEGCEVGIARLYLGAVAAGKGVERRIALLAFADRKNTGAKPKRL